MGFTWMWKIKEQFVAHNSLVFSVIETNCIVCGMFSRKVRRRVSTILYKSDLRETTNVKVSGLFHCLSLTRKRVSLLELWMYLRPLEVESIATSCQRFFGMTLFCFSYWLSTWMWFLLSFISIIWDFNNEYVFRFFQLRLKLWQNKFTFSYNKTSFWNMN